MKRNRIGTSLVWTVAVLFVMWVSVDAADTGFGGKWKGEIGAAAPARGGAPGTPVAPEVPATPFVQRGGGGGAGRGGAGGFGGGLGAARVQKVTLNLKTKDKDTKASGNITVGETTEDVKDGKIDGNKITFRAGTSPAPVYEYSGELNGDEIVMSRTAPGGRGGAVKFTLKRS